MNESLFDNKISYVSEKEKCSSLFLFLSLMLTSLIILSCLVQIRLSYKMTAIYSEEENVLNLYWPYDEIEKINQIEKIRIAKEESNFQIQNMSEIKVDEKNLMNYQIISIASPKKFRNNQVINLQILDQEELIIQKLKKLILEGG